MRRIEQQFKIPFKINQSQSQFLSQLEQWWRSSGEDSLVRVGSHPFNEKSTFMFVYWLLHKIAVSRRQTHVIFIVQSKTRAQFLLSFGQHVYKKYFQQDHSLYKILINPQYQIDRQLSQIIFTTMKQFIEKDLPNDNIYKYMIVESGNCIRMMTDAFKDYITDTYLRRSYIEILRYQQAYREHEKSQKIPNSNKGMNRQPSLEIVQPPELISLVSKQSQKQDHQINGESIKDRQPSNSVQQIQRKNIKKTFENKKQQIIKNIKPKNRQMMDQKLPVLYQQNQLILLSSLSYLIGYFYNQIQQKHKINLFKFLEQFQNKTHLRQQFLGNVLRYCQQIYKNSPQQIYKNLQQTYLYNFCRFLDRLNLYKNLFYEVNDLFRIRYDKFPFERRESFIEQSTSCAIIECQTNKIVQAIFKKKALNRLILQNFACPGDYWFYIFKQNNLLLESRRKSPQFLNKLLDEQQQNLKKEKFLKIYGLHVSKTPSNEDINFAEKQKPQIQRIKIKACGVLLYDLSKFIPDGIVVYFNSLEVLQIFNKQMQGEDEKILKKTDNNKKIFVQSIFQQQNNANFLKFKKCCQIGRGAIFLMTANGKTAQLLKFYHHYSRCIVFFGLPKLQGQIRKDKQKLIINQNEVVKQGEQIRQNPQHNYALYSQKICIINECINNCLNDLCDYKSIVFVGADIPNDLQDWYRHFIKGWDQTTRESLMKIRHHFQKMGANHQIMSKTIIT